jgi:predicted transposase YbfD/YdcC
MDADASRVALRFASPLEQIDDPRMDRTKRHSLEAIVLIALMAVICGADGWSQVELFGRSKLKWLKTFLHLPHGIPSHDTFGRVFSLLDPEQLERWFMQWTAKLAQATGGELIAIDGKTIRRSFDKTTKTGAIHMVSAWSQANEMVLGQLTTEAKSNEITAIPGLLALLDLSGAVVTIDAMGCQKNIARQIQEQGGDYILQVKDNHPSLHEDIKLWFDEAFAHDFEDTAYAHHETTDKGHGRVERRRCWTLFDPQDMACFTRHHDWTGLRSLVCVESTRHDLTTGTTSIEKRYFISSLPGADAAGMQAATRGHWKIENKLHWSLDINYREDECRIRKGHAPENFSRLKRLSQNMLKMDKSTKVGIHSKRLRCGWDHDYLLKILATAF